MDNKKSWKKVLVITADDFGYCEERNKGIVEAFIKGGVTRTSLMVNGGAAKEAAKLAIENNIPTGLHLNLTEGYPLSEQKDIPSLTDGRGMLLDKSKIHQAARDQKIYSNEVRLEMERQIEKFTELIGRPPYYVDGHQHVHIVPCIREVFAEVLVQHNIYETRLPIENFDHSPWLQESPYHQFLQDTVTLTKEAVQVFQQHNLRHSDKFYGMATMGSFMNFTRLQNGLSRAFLQDENASETDIDKMSNKKDQGLRSRTSNTLSTYDLINCVSHDQVAAIQDAASQSHDHNISTQGLILTCELMVHPGYPSNPKDLGCGGGVDLFSRSPDRLHELQILTSNTMLEYYRNREIQLKHTVM